VHAEMPYRILSSTGERVSAIGLGGWHLGFKKVDEQVRFSAASTSWITAGTTMTAPARPGWAKLRDGYRNKVFLMTKIDGRSEGFFDLPRGFFFSSPPHGLWSYGCGDALIFAPTICWPAVRSPLIYRE
jgi:hypothetical protein